MTNLGPPTWDVYNIYKLRIVIFKLLSTPRLPQVLKVHCALMTQFFGKPELLERLD